MDINNANSKLARLIEKLIESESSDGCSEGLTVVEQKWVIKLGQLYAGMRVPKHIMLKTLADLKKTAKWCGKGAERHRRIIFRMAVNLSDLVREDIEWLNNRADEEMLGDDLGGVGLSDLVYTAVGTAPGSEGYLKGKVILEADASVEDIIRELETKGDQQDK